MRKSIARAGFLKNGLGFLGMGELRERGVRVAGFVFLGARKAPCKHGGYTGEEDLV